MKAEDDVLVTFLLRTIRVTVWSTFLVVAALAVSVMLPGSGPNPSALALLLVVAAATGLGAALVPWDAILASGRGKLLFYAWNTTYIMMISAGIAVNGGGSSPIVLLYGLTTVFGAMAYPVRVQIVFLGYTVASYLLALRLAGWGVTPARVFLQLTALGALAFLSGFLSRELAKQMRAHVHARSESERRARLLEVVARAGRRVSSLDTEQVLEAVVGGATALGFEAANLAVFDDAGERFQVAFASGLPEEYADSTHPSTAGLPGLVRERGATVVIDDYSTHPNAIPILRDRGFHAALGTPVWVQGRLDAALVAGTHERRDITEEDVEALELLAALAGRGLENAQRFEDEHRAVQRLAELDRLKSDFLSNVSHELRTPLTAIEGMGLTLEQQWENIDEDTKRQLLSRLNANAGALHQIITTLLDFSRLEAGRLDVKAEAIELRPFVDRVVHRLGSLLETHPTTVDVGDGLTVAADPLLLERVMENLLSNATKHTPQGTAVEVAARDLGGEIELSVIDHGPGIPRDEVRYLGDRFFRGGDPNTRRTRGTGLGLAVVREILKLHDSALEIDSEEGAGSRFSFVLPVGVATSDQGAQTAATA
ncbi:MAG TPA: ATP-binding protein [Actinomycetota bacterium]|nr:ATP-binding protein [Actinomycetota bacterium]